MAQLVRFGVSMDVELLAAFDRMLARKGYAQRSEAIRELVRRALLDDGAENAACDAQTAVLCVVHDPGQGPMGQRLTDLETSEGVKIQASMHVSLDAERDLSVVIMQGQPADYQGLAGKIMRGQGVRDGQLVPLVARWG